MLYTMAISVDAFHLPTKEWFITKTQHGTRAVSRKHALKKGVAKAMSLPCYADRNGHPDWTVTAEVTIVEGE